MIPRLFAAIAAIVLMTQTLFAGAMTTVELEPITHTEAVLVVIDDTGTEHRFTPDDLEQLPTYSLTTATPWREVPAEFTGVLLMDLLAASNLSAANGIVVTAENDYSTILENDLLETVDILVATRVNGMAHTRRERGPIQFVIDAEAFAASDITSDSNLVWMAARIEAQQ